MNTCPICGRECARDTICSLCGYDPSMEYESFPTVFCVDDQKSLAARRQIWLQAQRTGKQRDDLHRCPKCGNRFRGERCNCGYFADKNAVAVVGKAPRKTLNPPEPDSVLEAEKKKAELLAQKRQKMEVETHQGENEQYERQQRKTESNRPRDTKADRHQQLEGETPKDSQPIEIPEEARQIVLRVAARLERMRQIKEYAAYAIGVADPADSLTAEKWSEIFSANKMTIQEKIDSWEKYGNIRAATIIPPGNDRLTYFWMVTDNRIVILAPIPRKRHKGSVLFNTIWSIGSYGKAIDAHGHELTEKEFIAFQPNQLVIDNNITVFSFNLHQEAFYQGGHHGVTSAEHDYYCKTLHWVEKLIFDPGLSFVPFSYSSRCYEEHDDINTLNDTADIWNCDGVSLIRDGLQIESSNARQLPYYIKDNIIYRKDSNEEVLCLNEKENERRYYASHHSQIEKVKARYRSNGLCQYCGGVFLGRFVKKCSKCGRKKNY